MKLKVKHKYINLLSHSPCSLSLSVSLSLYSFFLAESAPSLSRLFLLYLIGLQWLGWWVTPWVVGLGCGSHLRLKMKGLLWVLGFGLRLNMSSSMVCQGSFSFWLKVKDERVAVGFGLRLKMKGFQGNFMGRVVDGGLLKLMFGCGYGCSMVLGQCLVVRIAVCGCFEVVEWCLWVFFVYIILMYMLYIKI